MSTNPYEAQTLTQLSDGVEKVSIKPFTILKRGYALIEKQYWLFFLMTIAATFIASVVPFWVLMGPMMVGLFYSLMDLEAGKFIEFGRLFDGFKKFAESFLATLIMMALNIIVMIPASIVLVVVMILPIILAQQPGATQSQGQAEATAFLGFAIFYPCILVLSFACYLPFAFAYQLIAEHDLSGLEAVQLSLRGVIRNFLGIIWYFIFCSMVSALATFACCVPAFLLSPIFIASLFVLYRDIFQSFSPMEQLRT